MGEPGGLGYAIGRMRGARPLPGRRGDARLAEIGCGGAEIARLAADGAAVRPAGARGRTC